MPFMVLHKWHYAIYCIDNAIHGISNAINGIVNVALLMPFMALMASEMLHF